MKFWIYKESDSDNVLIIDETSLTVGSADKDNHKKVVAQLASGQSASEVLTT